MISARANTNNEWFFKFVGTGICRRYASKTFCFRTRQLEVEIKETDTNLQMNSCVWECSGYKKLFPSSSIDKFSILVKDNDHYVIRVNPPKGPSHLVFGGHGVFSVTGKYYMWIMKGDDEIVDCSSKSGPPVIGPSVIGLPTIGSYVFESHSLRPGQKREDLLRALNEKLRRYVHKNSSAASNPNPKSGPSVITQEDDGEETEMELSLPDKFDKTEDHDLILVEESPSSKRFKSMNKCGYCQVEDAVVLYQCDAFKKKDLIHNDLCDSCLKIIQEQFLKKKSVTFGDYSTKFMCMECKQPVNHILRII